MKDLHVHLYGCLSPLQIFELGNSIGVDHSKKDLYKDYYEKQYGRRPVWEEYWQKGGVEKISKDYLFLDGAPFPRFQACINLPVMAFPLEKSNHLLHAVLKEDSKKGHLDYIEYRCFMTPRLTIEQNRTYLLSLAAECRRAETLSFKPKIIVSMDRREDVYLKLYTWLIQLLGEEKELRDNIVGIDFCGFEFSPCSMENFFKRVRDESELQICLHVGEDFSNVPLEVSISWVYEAYRMGAHRLGHAISLGYPASLLEGKEIPVSKEERFKFQSWFGANKEWLGDFGYQGHQSSVTYSPKEIDSLTNLQNAVMKKMEGATIEVCPTSNLRIGQLPSYAAHPFHRFKKHKHIKLAICTDDPGVFETDLKKECDYLLNSR